MAIDKYEFVRFCLEQAAQFGTNAHYLVAVAQYRSGIVDDTNDASFGPYRFTQEHWDAVRSRAAQGIWRVHPMIHRDEPFNTLSIQDRSLKDRKQVRAKSRIGECNVKCSPRYRLRTGGR
ncbi:hypothetical protein ACVWXN_002690 [Bradyrhizobium sp. i1.4.4]